MDFNLTSEQRLIQDATRRMSEREIVPILKANDPTRPLPKEAMHCILKACASQGLTAPRIPEADGGAGVSALTLGVMCGRRLAVKHFILAWRRLRSGCSHVSGLLVQPFPRLLALM